MKSGYSISRSADQFVAVTVTPQGNDHWRLDDVSTFAAGSGPAPDLAKTLGRNGGRLNWLLQDEESNVAVTHLPRLKSKELERAVSGWLLREHGGDASTWSVGWQVTGTTAVGPGEPEQLDVAMAFAHRADIDRLTEKATAWRVRPSAMLPDYVALEQFYRTYGRPAEDLQGWNLVFVGRRRRFLCISSDRNLLLTRNLPVDLSAGADPEDYLNRLATEVDRSVFFARQTQQNPSIQKIIVCGDEVLSAQLVQRLATESSIPAEVWGLRDLFQWNGHEDDPDLLLSAISAALAGQPMPLSVLPPQRRVLFGPQVRKRVLMAAGTVAAAAVPVLLVGGLVTSAVQERYLERAQNELGEAEMRADEAARIYRDHGLLLAREDYIRDHTAEYRDFEAVLLRLADFTPDSIVFRDLQIRKPETGGYMLHLTGISGATTAGEAQATFLKFLASLDECGFLAAEGEPEQVQITTRDNEGRLQRQVVFSLAYTVLPVQEQEG